MDKGSSISKESTKADNRDTKKKRKTQRGSLKERDRVLCYLLIEPVLGGVVLGGVEVAAVAAVRSPAIIHHHCVLVRRLAGKQEEAGRDQNLREVLSSFFHSFIHSCYFFGCVPSSSFLSLLLLAWLFFVSSTSFFVCLSLTWRARRETRWSSKTLTTRKIKIAFCFVF